MSIVIDPYLIALPNSAAVEAEYVRQYAQRFSTWEKEFAKAADNYVMSQGAYCAIQQEGLMPTPQGLQRLFELCAIEEYSALDFATNCSTFLANCSYLEDRPGVADLYSEDVERLRESESVIPEEMRQRMAPSVADAFVTSLIYTAYDLKEQGATGEWLIATAPLKKAAATDLRTVGTVRRLDKQTSALVDTPIHKDWPLLIEPDYLYASYAVSAHMDDPVTATRITWCKRKTRDGAAAPIDGRVYTFGSRFVDSLKSSQMRRRTSYQEDIELVFTTVVEVLQGLAFGTKKHHVLRKIIWSRTAEVQKRKRTTPSGATVFDSAARVEVLDGTMPLRLHYWRCDDGSYEFSNVTTDHDDATIYH